MHNHNLFAVKIRSIQSTIAHIRQNSQWSGKDTKETIIDKDAYKGWFSQTRTILTALEKDEIEISIYEVIRYQ